MDCFIKIVEEKIQEVIRNGEFDHLEGFGKPIDHSDYFNAPEELRIAFHILKNAGVPPEEVQMLKSINQITKKLKNETQNFCQKNGSDKYCIISYTIA